MPYVSTLVGGRARMFDMRLLSVALVLLAVMSGIAVWSITKLVGPTSNASPPDSSTRGDDAAASAATAPSKLRTPAAAARAPMNITAESGRSATNVPKVAGLLGSVARADEPGGDRAIGTGGVMTAVELAADARATSRAEAPPAAVGEVEAPSEVAATDSLIYSSRDVDVVAPFVVWPAGLGRLPSSSRSADQSMIDVVVNSDGSVALATAQRSPRSLDEAMIMTMSLSAAKAWRFKPAVKDGRPVRYRQVITVSLR
jgi:hypothetical protein